LCCAYPRFTLDPSIGEFVLTGENLRIPEAPKQIYSINEGNYNTWDEHMQKAIDGFRLNKPAYSARYVGSMVADVHRTILYGGIYLYPADKAKGNGKLRILYEGFPMSMIMERAGGMASTGRFRGQITRLLDLQPTSIHDKCPVIVGCSRDVERVLSHYPQYTSPSATV
jgi:fructose-1,6-bisphosphatase I